MYVVLRPSYTDYSFYDGNNWTTKICDAKLYELVEARVVASCFEERCWYSEYNKIVKDLHSRNLGQNRYGGARFPKLIA